MINYVPYYILFKRLAFSTITNISADLLQRINKFNKNIGDILYT